MLNVAINLKPWLLLLSLFFAIFFNQDGTITEWEPDFISQSQRHYRSILGNKSSRERYLLAHPN